MFPIFSSFPSTLFLKSFNNLFTFITSSKLIILLSIIDSQNNLSDLKKCFGAAGKTSLDLLLILMCNLSSDFGHTLLPLQYAAPVAEW